MDKVRRWRNQTSSEEDGWPTGGIRWSLPRFAQSKSRVQPGKLPSFLPKPAARSPAPPVEIEYDRSTPRAICGKFDRAIGFRGAVLTKGL